ncbi:hypothetical protein BRADI_2g03051v3 [Brachypodium distachyon]|uniref:Uncharacterized protein n=1 Tax=Brachypodium distachyon TaxID=15368 RepID=A0A0Q3JW44_BRADI|nr:hypothetical protein BRADI_2g03051v3 [Brachypodium distachyon]
MADSTSSSSRFGFAAAFSDQVLMPRASGVQVDWNLTDVASRVVSLSTRTKVSDTSFVVGVAVGFTLKRRLRRWAARLLKRINDDNWPHNCNLLFFVHKWLLSIPKLKPCRLLWINCDEYKLVVFQLYVHHPF